MGHVPDHLPPTTAADHAARIVALDAGDLEGRARDDAAALAESCAGCASLLADLAVLRAATATLPPVRRTRDYRLTDADAARLRPSTWGRLVAWLGAPRSTVRPLAGGLAALGIAGLLLSATPGAIAPGAATLTTSGSSVTAPQDVLGQANPGEGAPAVNGAASAAASTAASTAPQAGSSPAETAVIGVAGATPPRGEIPAPSAAAAIRPETSAAPSLAAAALPAPSPAAAAPSLAAAIRPDTSPAPSQAAAALPAPTPAPVTDGVIGPNTSAAPESPGFAIGAGPGDSSSKAVPPDASQAQRSTALAAESERTPNTPDRTPGLLVSLALLALGAGLFVANRVLRRRTGA